MLGDVRQDAAANERIEPNDSSSTSQAPANDWATHAVDTVVVLNVFWAFAFLLWFANVSSADREGLVFAFGASGAVVQIFLAVSSCGLASEVNASQLCILSSLFWGPCVYVFGLFAADSEFEMGAFTNVLVCVLLGFWTFVGSCLLCAVLRAFGWRWRDAPASPLGLPRFSLRSIFGVILIVAVVCGLWRNFAQAGFEWMLFWVFLATCIGGLLFAAILASSDRTAPFAKVIVVTAAVYAIAFVGNWAFSLRGEPLDRAIRFALAPAFLTATLSLNLAILRAGGVWLARSPADSYWRRRDAESDGHKTLRA